MWAPKVNSVGVVWRSKRGAGGGAPALAATRPALRKAARVGLCLCRRAAQPATGALPRPSRA